jgi:hypothetical protein
MYFHSDLQKNIFIDLCVTIAPIVLQIYIYIWGGGGDFSKGYISLHMPLENLLMMDCILWPFVPAGTYFSQRINYFCYDRL